MKRPLVLAVLLIVASVRGLAEQSTVVAKATGVLLTGSYRATSSEHPVVFGDRRHYQTLLESRMPTARKSLERLEALVAGQLKSGSRYIATYDGCELDEYLRRLTYEQSGAAKVAADLALYAYLATLDRSYGRTELALQAKDLSKAILLTWAQRGMREADKVRTQLNQFCENGRVNLVSQLDVGLQIGRGMPFWVHAQDLLLAMGAFKPAEAAELDGFLRQTFSLLLRASQFWSKHAYTDCERYGNHTSIHILAMLSIARLRDDAEMVVEVATGARGQVAIPWTSQVVQSIYGVNARPRDCTVSDKSFQIPSVAPGEIVDRHRSGENQTLGYPLYSLTALLRAARILQGAGFQPMKLEGDGRQSLNLALQYYGYYFTRFLASHRAVVIDDDNYPSARQYAGKPVSGPDGVTIEGKDDSLEPFLLGYCLDPNSSGAAKVIRKAMGLSPVPFHAVKNLAITCLEALPD